MIAQKRYADADCDCRGLCRASASPGIFEKLTGFNREELAIYHYYVNPGKDYQNKNVQKARVLILENKSPSDVAINNITDPVERYTKCRCTDCFKILRETCEMLKYIGTIKKDEVRGICNKCYNDKDYKSVNCAQCAGALEYFLETKHTKDEDTLEKVHNWLENIDDVSQRGAICPICRKHQIASQRNILGVKKLRVGELFHRFLNKSCKCVKSNTYYQRPVHSKIDTSKFMEDKGAEPPCVCLEKKIEDLTKVSSVDTGLDDEEVSKTILDGKEQESHTRRGSKRESDQNKIKQDITKGETKDSTNKGKDSGKKGKSSKIKGDDSKNKDEELKGKRKDSKNKGEDLKNKDEELKNKRKDSKNKDEDVKNKRKDSKNKDDDLKNKGEDLKNKGKDVKNKGDDSKNMGEDSKNKGKDLKNKDTDQDKAKEKKKPSKDETGDLFAKRLQQQKAAALLKEQEKAKKLEEEKRKREEELKLRREAQAAVKPPEPKKILASPSDILRFFEKSKDQRNKFGDYEPKSLLHPYDEDNCNKFGLLDLPRFGQIYRQDAESLSTFQMNKHATDKTNLKMFNLKKDGLKIPLTGEKEGQVCTLEYKIRDRTKDEIKRATSKIEILDDPDSDMSVVVDTENKQKYFKMIFGTKVRKYYSKAFDECEPQREPLLFAKVEGSDDYLKYSDEGGSGDASKLETPKKRIKHDDESSGSSRGEFRYALSNRKFIDKGWTMLPMLKVVKKMDVYRMRPSEPEFDWFARNKNRSIYYDSGQLLAKIDENGHGALYYKNGLTALEHYSPEDINTQKRYIIYSCGVDKCTEKPAPINVLACFDWLGNGVVYDETGKVRLKYDQNEGVVSDRTLGPESHWKWHTLNDPAELCHIMMDNELPHKEPEISKYKRDERGRAAEKKAAQKNGDDKRPTDSEEMLAIELEQSANEKSKKLCFQFKPNQIKTKALQINEYFSLKVVDQTRVYLLFRDGQNSIKINLGMMLDPSEIIGADKTELGEVGGPYGRIPAPTDSLYDIYERISKAKRRNIFYTERKERICRPPR